MEESDPGDVMPGIATVDEEQQIDSGLSMVSFKRCVCVCVCVCVCTCIHVCTCALLSWIPNVIFAF